MGHNQIAVCCGGVGECALLVRSQAICLPAAIAEDLEHSSARVDGIGAQVWDVRQQPFKEAAISIPQNQRSSAIAKLRKEVRSTALERRSECHVFE